MFAYIQNISIHFLYRKTALHKSSKHYFFWCFNTNKTNVVLSIIENTYSQYVFFLLNVSYLNTYLSKDRLGQVTGKFWYFKINVKNAYLFNPKVLIQKFFLLADIFKFFFSL